MKAILVKIGLRPNGQADHPDFSSLPSVQASGMDWSRYIDAHGSGWIYDKSSGHREDDSGRARFPSQRGEQWAALVVPNAFAAEAVSAFPETCSHLTEAELEEFHDNHATAHLPEFDRDAETLSALQAERALRSRASRPSDPKLAELDVEIDSALDPDSQIRGVVRNPHRRWATVKARRGFTIDP